MQQFKNAKTYEEGIENLIDAAVKDFQGWTSKFTDQKTFEEVRNKYRVEDNRKYTKILYQNGAWGFVQKQDDKRFKKGDLLKPAGYYAPARNYSRGNIFTGGVVNWTGPLYMN